jgi:hypothetical protein
MSGGCGMAATFTNAAVTPQILPAPLRFAAAAWGGVVSDRTAGLWTAGLSAGAAAAGRVSVVSSLCPRWTARPADFRSFLAIFRTAARAGGALSRTGFGQP